MQEFQPNETIGNRYKVIRKLGAGAMGSVYLCEDSVENHIKVALKVLVSDNLEDQDVWAKGEYEALTRLRHPNLARVYNFGRIGDTKDYFIVSEFIKGIDLYSATEYQRYDELVDIIVQICRALEYIHSQGYVHFDIKPDNILVTRYKTVGIKEGSKVQYNEMDLDGSKREMCAKPNVKLIDFGLAEKITGSFSFAIKGTLNYLAPEILNGQTPDKRADLYSLGVTLYQVTNRDLPFYQEINFPGSPSRSTKRSELFEMHMKKHPDYLRTVILKLLEENVEERFQSAKEVIQHLNRHSDFHFDLETAETRESYFYSSKLVGRRREMNLLKEYHERIFFPQRGAEAKPPPERAPAAGDPAREEVPPGGGETELDDDTAVDMLPVGEVPAAAETPALVLVSGEMGAGKSRLLEEFQHYLRLQDLCFLSGNCYEANRKAYQPIIEVLRQAVYTLGLDSEVCKSYRKDLVRLLPEMREKPMNRDLQSIEDERSGGVGPDQERIHFIERVSQLFMDVSRAAPQVLIINNLHWVDEASVDLLQNLLIRVGESRRAGQPLKLLILASIRPEEILSDGLREALEKLKADGVCREVHVRCLKYAQIREFLCSMLNLTEAPGGFVAKLMEKTGGNPLFVVETLKALEEDGVIKNTGDGWVIKATNYDRIEIPHRMEDLLAKRLEKLDSQKRELLDILAVLDKPANPRFIQAMKRFAENPILVELRNLEQAGLVMNSFEGGKLHFQIAQPKVREIVYATIAEEKRRRYHGEVGDAFADLYRGRDEEILEELAYHYQRSDQPRKALDLSARAGDRLKRIFANERAHEYYMYVLEKSEGDASLFPIWTDTHEKLGDICTTMGHYEMAERSYSVLINADVRKRLDPRRAVKIFISRGKVFEIQGDYDLALKSYKDARNFLAGFARNELVVERIRVFNSIGWVYVCMGKYEKAMAISLEALRVIEGGPEKIEHAMVYNTIGSANFFKGNFREAIEYHRKSLQIKENIENIPEITISLNNLGSAHMAGCEYGEAAEHFQRALKTSEEIGDPYGRAVSLHNFARLYFAVGQTDKGWECLDESLKLSKIHNMRFLTIQNYLVRGKALLDQGDGTKAEGNFFRALTAFTKQANRWGLCTVLLAISELHRTAGNFKEALSMVGEARRYAEELDIHNLQALALAEEARLRREQGETGVQASVKLLEDALALVEKCDQPELSREIHWEMGETQARLRRLREAAQYYKVAEEKLKEVTENLPEVFRQSYAARQKLRFRDARHSSPALAPADAKAALPGGESAPSAPEGKERPAETRTERSAEDSLGRLNALMARLCSGGGLKDFLGHLLDDVVEVSASVVGYLLFVQGESLTVETSRRGDGGVPGEPEHTLCMPLIERALTEAGPLFLADTADDPGVAAELEKQGTPCGSLAIIPFSIEKGRQGVLYLIDPRIPKAGAGKSSGLEPFLSLAALAYHQLAPEAILSPS